ncbi:MAG: heavy-metal-associated domain-containing protein [Paracoccaceae bacterium]|jgi:copper chaperone|nr:heavy-metal-associated domain-containing protein [Paracoccaceae bacterium]MDP7186256.1 heavy-metal-associated domain-containing protein [Paracoccaceae bacterium]
MEFNVPEMSCGHCTAAIEKALKESDPAAEVNCDLDTRRVAVTSALSQAQVSEAIKQAGYDSELVGA